MSSLSSRPCLTQHRLVRHPVVALVALAVLIFPQIVFPLVAASAQPVKRLLAEREFLEKELAKNPNGLVIKNAIRQVDDALEEALTGPLWGGEINEMNRANAILVETVSCALIFIIVFCGTVVFSYWRRKRIVVLDILIGLLMALVFAGIATPMIYPAP